MIHISLKSIAGNDIGSVIACSHPHYLPKAVRDTRFCMVRSARLLRRMVVSGCSACQHQFGTVTEKGERKVGCPARDDCYNLSLHTLLWTVEIKTRASARKLVDLGALGCISACSVHLSVAQRS
jgi:hypothetical protein